MRLLYVEDNRINALLFEEAMRLLGGIELQVAESGADAIGLLQAWTPQVLVLDANLPDMNGHELLQRPAPAVRTGRRTGLHVLGRRDAGGSGARPRQRLPGLLDQADRDRQGRRGDRGTARIIARRLRPTMRFAAEPQPRPTADRTAVVLVNPARPMRRPRPRCRYLAEFLADPRGRDPASCCGGPSCTA